MASECRAATAVPILLIPGFTAGDWSLGTLARWLGRIGYKPYLSGIDLNVGCPRRKVELVGWRVEKIARETGQRVTIIGHSLGGVLGRAIAASNPAASCAKWSRSARRFATDGRGVHDQMRPTMQAIQSFWQTFSSAPENCGTMECACGIAEAVFAPTPPRCRFSAIYTRRDEVVQWQSCIDDEGIQLRSVGTAREPDRQSRGFSAARHRSWPAPQSRTPPLEPFPPVVSIHQLKIPTTRRFRRGISSRFRPDQRRAQTSLRDSRQGEPVALIMGFSGSGRGWGEAFLKLMEARFKIFVIDNRGTGESDKPDVEFTLGDLAADIAAVLDHAKTPRAHIFGISMGGMIAQEFVLAYPERTRGLVLGCTNCGTSHSVAGRSGGDRQPDTGARDGSDRAGAARIFGRMRKGVSQFGSGAGDSRRRRSPRWAITR